jgi:cyclic lactone autoinducer peptide
MKISKKNLLTLVATAATLMASLVASSACTFFMYQPEEPKILQEE